MPTTPIAWTDPIEVTTDGRLSRDTQIAALADGGFVVVATQGSGTATPDFDIVYQLYDADGSPRGALQAFANSTTIGIVANNPFDVVGNADGGFTILLNYQYNGNSSDNDTRLLKFDSAGVLETSSPVNISSDRDEIGADIAATGDGIISVSTGGNGGGAGAFEYISPSFSVDLAPFADPSVTLDPAAGSTRDTIQVAYLGDGKAVVAYRETSADPGTTLPFDIVSTTDGTVLFSGAANDAPGDLDFLHDVQALPDGGFVIVSTDFDGLGATNPRHFYEYFDENGVRGGATQFGLDYPDATSIELAVSDKAALITWSDFGSGDVLAQRFSVVTGNAVGNVVTVFDGDVNSNARPSVTALEDGRFAISYIDADSSVTGDAQIVILDPRDGVVIAKDDVDTTAPVNGGTVVGVGGRGDLIGSDNDDTFAVSQDQRGAIDGRGGVDTLSLASLDTSAGPGTVAVLGSLGAPGSDDGVLLSLAGLINVSNVENFIGTNIVDQVGGSDGDNVFELLAGDDTYVVTRGDDVANGGTGIDTIDFSNADAALDMPEVNFRLFDTGAQASGFTYFEAWTIVEGSIAASGFENVVGSDGNDTITGSLVDNEIRGGDGNDFLLGAGGDDILRGEAGNDRLRGGAGDDEIIGGAGSDFADYFGGSADVTVGLSFAGAQNTGQGRDTLSGIENIISGDGNDTLTGNFQANILISNGGDDVLNGGAGNDTLRGGAGTNQLNGGSGLDTADFADATGGVTLALAAATFQNTGGGGIVRLNSIENAIGGRFDDTIAGDGGDNVLSGSFGNDVIAGGAGADTIDGGRGGDTLTGGAGADVFVYGRLGFRDTITDFQDDVDTIDLTDFGFATVAEAQANAAQVGSDVVYTFTPGPGAGTEVLTVENTTIAALSDDLLI